MPNWGVELREGVQSYITRIDVASWKDPRLTVEMVSLDDSRTRCRLTCGGATSVILLIDKSFKRHMTWKDGRLKDFLLAWVCHVGWPRSSGTPCQKIFGQLTERILKTHFYKKAFLEWINCLLSLIFFSSILFLLPCFFICSIVPVLLSC